ncbi:SAV_915 family protein [Streptomyces griseoloalbus]|uniref:SAV_915 family protein n=1 Tax=Streptomyces griseoloalbus TaxID=67303 RepID=UPI00339F9C1D
MPESNPEYLVLPTLSEVRQSSDGSSPDGSTVEATLVPVAAPDGGEQLVALAFTSVSLLVEAMGEEQPWVVVPAREAEGALEGSGARALLVDPRLAVGSE